MLVELKHAGEHIDRMRVDRASATQEIGVESAREATLMLQDLEGWARVFRVKVMEAG